MIALTIALLAPPPCPALPDRASFSTEAAHSDASQAAAHCLCRDAEADDPAAELDGPKQLRCAYRLHDEGRFADAVVVYERWFARREAPPGMLLSATPFRDRAARCVPRMEDSPDDRCAPPTCEARAAAATDPPAWSAVAACFAARAEAGEAVDWRPAARALERAGRRAEALAAWRRLLEASPDPAVEAHLDARYPARLTVRCTPTAALVRVGEHHGRCPTAELALPDGEHRVTVHAAGHHPSSHVVRLAHDERHGLTVDLESEARWAPWVAGALGAAATGAGVILHVRNNQSFTALRADPGSQALRDEVDLTFGGAVGSYAVGALCVSLAAWLWLDDDEPTIEEAQAWTW